MSAGVGEPMFLATTDHCSFITTAQNYAEEAVLGDLDYERKEWITDSTWQII